MAKPPSEFQKYGLIWPSNQCPVELEMYMIRHGGQWIDKKTNCTLGLGLFHHYKALQTLLWPEDDHHRWSDLILKHVVEERICVILGPKDSSKTRTLAKFGLSDYFCFPKITLTLVSSTDLRGLELRVWGDIKELFNRAKDNYDDLPGNIVDSKHGIFTDDIKDETRARDIRRGLLCFPAGTFVDTPTGKVKINCLNPGDSVLNASGIGIIKETYERIAPQLLRVILTDGREIDCTPEHPFFTNRGWIKAIALETCDVVFSADETMSLLQPTFGSRKSESQILFKRMSRASSSKTLCSMRQYFSSLESQRQRSYRQVLQHDLRESLGIGSQTFSRESSQEMPELWKENVLPSESGILFGALPKSSRDISVQGMRKRFYVDSAKQDKREISILRSILQAEMVNEEKWRKPSSENEGGEYDFETVSTINTAPSRFYRTQNHKECEALVRVGHCISVSQTGCGNRRRVAPDAEEKGERFNTNGQTQQTRVACVAILDPRGDSRFDKSEGGYRVHNLEVTGHPSYSVNGVIVHNCIPCVGSQGEWTGGLEKFAGAKQKRRRVIGDELAFMQLSYLSAIEHLDKGDFKGAFAANPVGQNDPADKLAEPVGGWGTEPDSEKTEVWRNKFGGITINLDGRDTPNNDEPKNRFPYLIKPEDIDRTAERCGKDSMEYWVQVVGKRKPGLFSHRVLTTQMCENFGAFEMVVWMGSPLTKIYAIDASYGGDRCVAGAGEFGKDVNDNLVLSFGEQVIIPISIVSPKIPEDQIAEFVRMDCESKGIAPENVFFDATGRGSLGTSFARIWSAKVNPVEFGGAATTRPVCADLFIVDVKTGARRLKRCDEHYSKRVTEFWFSVRYVVESRQARNFPRESADEFSMREWYLVKGDRYELETKEETKARMGCSPDKADQTAILCEGARRLGFRIAKLEPPQISVADLQWKSDARKQAEDLRKSYSLSHAN